MPRRYALEFADSASALRHCSAINYEAAYPALKWDVEEQATDAVRIDLVLAAVKDLATDFLYYDRKEDDQLPIGAINALLDSGALTIDEIVAAFRESLEGDL